MTSIAPIHLNYSKQLIKKAARAYWRRYIAPLSIGLLLTLTIILIVDLFIHGKTGYVGHISIILLLSGTTAAASYFMILRQAFVPFNRMKKLEAMLELSDDGFKITSNINSSEFRWAVISKIMRLENAWVICFSKYGIMVLPISNVNPEAKEFILSKIKKYNAEII